MQVTRRDFFVKGSINLAAIAAGGSLVTVAKEQIKEKFDKQAPEATPVNQVTDFTIGGALGLTLKKVVEKSIQLKHLNKELSSTVSKLQKLEKTDLPGVERTLKDFVEKEGIIRYESNNNPVESILGLLNAVLIHADSQKPYLDELKKLRTVFAEPFANKLEHGGDLNTAMNEAMIHFLRSNKLTEYMVTVIINALNASGAGEKIGGNTIDSLVKENLVSRDGVAAFKETVTKALGSDSTKEALEYAISAEIIELRTAGRIMNSLLRKYKTGLKDNDPDMVALKGLFAKALTNATVPAELTRAVGNAVANPNSAK